MKRLLAWAALAAAVAMPLAAQTDGTGTSSDSRVNTLDGRFLKHLVLDQKEMWWDGPKDLRLEDAEYLVPLAGITAGLMMTDRTSAAEMSRNHRDEFRLSSDAGLAALGASGVAMYGFGRLHGDDHMQETGLLAGEAALDAWGADELFEVAFRRERPDEDSGAGRFFEPGGRSFPSNHAATAFAIAAVTANEYPGMATKILAYGLATGISLARVGAAEHFPSDVFVGGVLGYMIGRSVYQRRHSEDGLNYGTFESEAKELPLSSMSSSYIELDSWIYPAVDRLAALGVVRLNYLGLRPWTRLAVYQMVYEADPGDYGGEAAPLIEAVKGELERESKLAQGSPNQAITVDQIYERTQYTFSTPLNDSYHFGETITDDFGRPYGKGLQQIAGFETRAEDGRFSYYVRGEYQHSPSVPAYNQSVDAIIANQDQNPFTSYGQPTRDAFRLLDAYVSLNALGQDISVGKQSYWWGPDFSSSLMLSDNAEPFYSLRIARTTPFMIPLLSRLLGPVRYDNFFGKLSGHENPAQPYFYGNKLSFRPTENWEVGFSRDAVIGGVDTAPLTFGLFWHSFTSTSSSECAGCSRRNNAGARHSNFDFSYRLPGVRKYVTLYTDAMIHDDVSPLSAPRHSAMMPGLYVSQIPGVPKLDFHIEGGETDPPYWRGQGGHYYYWEGIYHDGYTNKTVLMGSWLGRQGVGGQAWLTYWLSPRSTVQAGYRTVKVSHAFVPEGLTQNDPYGEVNYFFKRGFSLQGLFQYERWVAPVLAAGTQHDVTAQLQLAFNPKDWKLEKH
jgi:hypothetical protein